MDYGGRKVQALCSDLTATGAAYQRCPLLPERASQSFCREWGRPRGWAGRGDGDTASSPGSGRCLAGWTGMAGGLDPESTRNARLWHGVGTLPEGTPRGDCSCSTPTPGSCRAGGLQKDSVPGEETEAMWWVRRRGSVLAPGTPGPCRGKSGTARAEATELSSIRTLELATLSRCT